MLDPRKRRRRLLPFLLLSGLLLIVLAACGGSQQSNQAIKDQVLRFPNVGTGDIGKLDPASGSDSNSNLAVSMLFSGLVKADKDLNVLPDQATWDISKDNKVYTFHLKQGITFSDGTPVTAQTYVYTWTRALLPEVKSPIAPVLEEVIVGAKDVNNGKTTTLEGVKAIDDQTLQVTLEHPTAYFLQLLTVNLFYPLNKNLIDKYGQVDWVQHVTGNGAGTGPFVVQSWQPGVKIDFVPNPHYYGNKTTLKKVEMYFVKEPETAYKAYQAKQYDFVWGLTAQDQETAKNQPGFTRRSILQSSLLFFDNKTVPFNKSAVRQAFAAAIDKNVLASKIFKDTVTPASTIIPPGEPGAQPDYPGIAYNQAKAKQLLQSVYPDTSKVPPITFTYPESQFPRNAATALQGMWQTALGVQVKLNPMELTAYNSETSKHTVQFGFTQWGVYFPDPYEWLNLSLLSTSANNNGDWNNPKFDGLVAQAEQKSGQDRLNTYAEAERVAIDDVGWLPLSHQTFTAIIPSYVHGIVLNGSGLYFGDWSTITLS
ncbi:peptide ABC transporter substrate-binding protein [Ktedonospora formicarum]|uniref:ABC transporter substrate-binding protein n=1 Tax=Ktedonospora formicarum TaxID=2778364 RepID=A0A8J3HSH4_9CHLR|nr:peptide ABC transporter substrate-binding protein [Ktedonospora formicarum]GHO42854.1 ABC transporter substrate-binding protein [Ktedonospora formicarum]